MLVNDLYTVLGSRAEPESDPDTVLPRPMTTETKQIETVDNDYTGSLLQALSP